MMVMEGVISVQAIPDERWNPVWVSIPQCCWFHQGPDTCVLMLWRHPVMRVGDAGRYRSMSHSRFDRLEKV
jgi:hypothetical protein